MSIKGKAYIAGAYEHPTRHAPDKTVAQLHAEVALGALADACGDVLLDLHSDPDHHRSVFTLGGSAGEVQDAARSLADTLFPGHE